MVVLLQSSSTISICLIFLLWTDEKDLTFVKEMSKTSNFSYWAQNLRILETNFQFVIHKSKRRKGNKQKKE